MSSWADYHEHARELWDAIREIDPGCSISIYVESDRWACSVMLSFDDDEVYTVGGDPLRALEDALPVVQERWQHGGEHRGPATPPRTSS